MRLLRVIHVVGLHNACGVWTRCVGETTVAHLHHIAPRVENLGAHSPPVIHTERWKTTFAATGCHAHLSKPQLLRGASLVYAKPNPVIVNTDLAIHLVPREKLRLVWLEVCCLVVGQLAENDASLQTCGC
jgi:hypothetical protein